MGDSSLPAMGPKRRQALALFGPQARFVAACYTGFLVDDGFGLVWIILDRVDRPVNLLDFVALTDLRALYIQAASVQNAELIVLYSCQRSFIAGADVKLIFPIMNPELAAQVSLQGQYLNNFIETFPLPTLAAIKGACLGGGLELALSCEYRVCAASDTKLGLPEVMLGLLPGAGGTVRLPETIGLAAALPMMLAGTSVSPARAKRLRLVDAVLPDQDQYPGESRWFHGLREYARKLLVRVERLNAVRRRARRSKPSTLSTLYTIQMPTPGLDRTVITDGIDSLAPCTASGSGLADGASAPALDVGSGSGSGLAALRLPAPAPPPSEDAPPVPPFERVEPQRAWKHARHLGTVHQTAIRSWVGRTVVALMARRRLDRLTCGHYPAPYHILALLRAYGTRPRTAAFAAEARAFGTLVGTRVSKNLCMLMLQREGAKRNPFPPTVVGTEPLRTAAVARAAVIGAGVMGAGIALLLARRGITVHLKDIRQEFLARGFAHIDRDLAQQVKRRRMTHAGAAEVRARVHGTLDYAPLAGAALVVEAVIERLDLKQRVVRELDAAMGDTPYVFATNTSSLSIDEIARAARAPARVVGMHFFNPVSRMMLVEVVRGRATDDAAAGVVHALAVRLGKLPVLVGNRPGFVVNRLLCIYLFEAMHLLAEGASITAIDGALIDFGMPMGPLRLLDEVGHDVGDYVAGVLVAGLSPKRFAPIAAWERFRGARETASLFAGGKRLGRKTGLGFYRYDARTHREAGVDPVLCAALARFRKGRSVPAHTIVRRCVLVMVAEAMRVLEEGLVTSAAHLDLAMVFGTGFAPFRGGPLQFADHEGLPALLCELGGLERAHGPRFAPPELLQRLCREGKTLFPDRPITHPTPRTLGAHPKL